MQKKQKNFAPRKLPLAWAKDFGARIVYIRNKAGLTQHQLAATSGLASPDSVTRLERGVSTRVNLSLLNEVRLLASEFGLSADWLLTGRDPATGSSPHKGLDWLTTASRDELTVELMRLQIDQDVIERFLKVADDPRGRTSLARALKPQHPQHTDLPKSSAE